MRYASFFPSSSIREVDKERETESERQRERARKWKRKRRKKRKRGRMNLKMMMMMLMLMMMISGIVDRFPPTGYTTPRKEKKKPSQAKPSKLS